jgi:hypothetical protein
MKPQGFNTDGTVIITVVWHRFLTTVFKRWNGGFFVKKRFPFALARVKKLKFISLRREGFQPDLEKNGTVRFRL